MNTKNLAAFLLLFRRQGGTLLRSHPEIKLGIASSTNVAFARNLKKNPNILWAEQDVVVQWLPNSPTQKMTQSFEGPIAAAEPEDAFFLPLQWSIFITDTDQAWGVTKGDSAVKVAVLDSGICAHHIDTTGKVDVAESASFVTETDPACTAAIVACPTCPSWEDYRFHGTAVVSLISTNNLGMAGVAPNVRLRAVKVLSCGGSGSFGGIISGIIHATLTGNQIINMSLGAYGGKTASGTLIGALNKAVNFAKSFGVFVVSAAGNNSADLDNDGNNTAIPCQSGSGFCVGATGFTDELASYSAHGISGPQIVAPGGDFDPVNDPATLGLILAACSPHNVKAFPCSPFDYLIASGTSFAAPLTSGAAALISSIASKGPGTESPSLIRNKLIEGAEDLGVFGPDNIFSHGRLNTLNSVAISQLF